MKREVENKIIEKIKKGCQPVYYGEEGFIVISMKAYLTAAEYAGAESSYFYYGDVCFDLINVNNRSDEIEAEDFDFMPLKLEEDFEEISPEEIESPEGRSDEIVSNLEDAEAMYMLINDRLRLLAARLYELRHDRVLNPEVRKIDDNIQDIVAEMERYEKMLSRIIAYIRAKKLGGEE